MLNPRAEVNVEPGKLADLITSSIRRQVSAAGTVTDYREPLLGFVTADDPRFPVLQQVAEPTHMMPHELLPGARSVVAFFVPFDQQVVEPNTRHREQVAHEWAEAYVETNALIGQITAHLIRVLAEHDIRATAEPATGNFDPRTLTNRWSHKSIAVLAGLGSLGLHHLLITAAGCAGRLGSLVLDADLPVNPARPKERCLYFHDGICLECVMRCPVGALDENGGLDKQRCWSRCLEIARQYAHLGTAEVCGKCAIGPCTYEAAVHEHLD
jgi:epoxyqueuosine reductase